jgi:hypothetical protein
MTHHLTPDELLDAVEAMHTRDKGDVRDRREFSPPPGARHLEACASCRTQVASLATLMNDVRAVEVPEASPLFWDHLSARVAQVIADESTARGASPTGWWRWRVLLPAAGLAASVFALVASLPSDISTPVSPVATVNTVAAPATELPDPTTAADEGWDLVADLVGTLDLETIHEAGLAAPGAAEFAVLDLTDSERQELVRLLEAELKGTGG